MDKPFLNVGKIVNTHGIRGELKVLPHTDFPEERFRKGSELVLEHLNVRNAVVLRVESAREHKNVYIVKFEGLNDINAAEKYKGGMLKIPADELGALPEDQYYFHEIVGCAVMTVEGESVGTIVEILTPGANDVWVVEQHKGKQVLIPVIDDVIVSVDVERKVVKIRPMEGLL